MICLKQGAVKLVQHSPKWQFILKKAEYL